VNTPRLENPSLVLPPPQTEGNKKFEKNFDRWGDPNSKFLGLSNGTGRGGGQGSGDGTGQGSGTGTGAGSGSGSGYGSGIGNGNGDGTGDGSGGRGGAPPPAAGISQPLKITAKQKAQYTDAARQNNVQGTVTLRVTFLASGSIGSIATIKGLPYGLTEQAIAAARAMRFEPEKVNGVPRTTSRPVSFTFNIY
jgi:TonB family protein